MEDALLIHHIGYSNQNSYRPLDSSKSVKQAKRKFRISS